MVTQTAKCLLCKKINRFQPLTVSPCWCSLDHLYRSPAKHMIITQTIDNGFSASKMVFIREMQHIFCIVVSCMGRSSLHGMDDLIGICLLKQWGFVLGSVAKQAGLSPRVSVDQITETLHQISQSVSNQMLGQVFILNFSIVYFARGDIIMVCIISL